MNAQLRLTNRNPKWIQNSLDAQREAGEAFVASQKNERWVCLPDQYDDGGFSGGNMERQGEPPKDLSDLLPDQWLQMHPDARRGWSR